MTEHSLVIFAIITLCVIGISMNHFGNWLIRVSIQDEDNAGSIFLLGCVCIVLSLLPFALAINTASVHQP